MPKVSIIMPSYNSEKYIEKAIKSVFLQTFVDWELIIIDDNSKDDTLEVVKRLKTNRVIVLKNEKNMGAGCSRNKAIDIATGRYIAFLDSDDIWEKEKLEKQIDFMKKSDISFSFSSYERISEESEKTLKTLNLPSKVDYNTILKNIIILLSTVIIDTKKIDKELLKMPNIKTSEEVVMYFNVLKNNVIAYGLDESLIKYRVRKKSLSSNKFKNMFQLLKIYKEYEHLNIWQRIKNIVLYATNATIKRIHL